ncbi:DeoR/GlpR family DNA-binding transcription regulator [Paenibacillus pasadenensis]|uniref:DeoR/GlpR family DNA-binding transcription regulator n=1 Tax=Paenibacillus pasadenensis TaxID=217090 RepID=UPI00203B3E36|nr:DeoR/GlpR family DNA-binding transcription regulator [Paenibacillus pasadenensis]MCM3749983.1 DeoR/GlpR family DNA-binding transcription regulator [Paenibacillus pasadenensis]
MSLSFEKRKKKILEYVSKEGKVEVTVLADEFNVSAETIRRDLERLDNDGKLKKVYGGAVKVRADSSELPFEQKTQINAAQKAAIGKYAAAMINYGDTVMLGNGTTMLEVIRNLGDRADVTIVTHSAPAMLLAMEVFPGRIIFTGGELNKHQKTTSGPLSELMLDQLRVNKTFLSAGGLSLKDGVTDYALSEATISRKMIERADETIFLADSSKFGKATFAKICSLDDVYSIVTDRECPEEWQNNLNDRDIAIFIADKED